jgi:protein SCO1/2
MPKVNRREWIAASGATLLAGGLVAQAQTPAPAQTPGGQTKWQTISPREAFRARHLPNVVLTTHEGKKVRFYDDLIKDKIVVINMMYATCEGVCPRITSNLQQVQKLLGDRVGRDVFFYSITLKPEKDTPQVLKEHVAMHKIKPGWLFLTGAPADIEILRRKLGFVDPDPKVDADKANHIGNVRYGNEPLMLWAAAPGLSKASAIAESIEWVDWPKNEADAKGKGEQK